MSERCEQTSERTSERPSTLRVDFIVIPTQCGVDGRNGGKELEEGKNVAKNATQKNIEDREMRKKTPCNDHLNR